MQPALYILDTPEKRERCAKRVLALPLDGEVWQVSVKPWQPQRSVEANRRLWALHQLAAEKTGHSVDELHEFMKYKFLPHAYVKVGKQTIEVPGRSSKLTSKEFRDFMDQVEAFYISELGVLLGEFA